MSVGKEGFHGDEARCEVKGDTLQSKCLALCSIGLWWITEEEEEEYQLCWTDWLSRVLRELKHPGGGVWTRLVMGNSVRLCCSYLAKS